MKFKMAATAGLSLTLDPMGKMLQNATSLKLNQTVKKKYLLNNNNDDGKHRLAICLHFLSITATDL